MSSPKTVAIAATLTRNEALALASKLIDAVKYGSDYCQLSAAASDGSRTTDAVAVTVEVNAARVLSTSFETSAAITWDMAKAQ